RPCDRLGSHDGSGVVAVAHLDLVADDVEHSEPEPAPPLTALVHVPGLLPHSVREADFRRAWYWNTAVPDATRKCDVVLPRDRHTAVLVAPEPGADPAPGEHSAELLSERVPEVLRVEVGDVLVVTEQDQPPVLACRLVANCGHELPPRILQDAF